MGVKELSEMVAQYMARFFAEKFTGKVIITFNMRNGGIGSTNVQIEHDLPKWSKEKIEES